jgi:hypothetical protein
MLPALLWRTCVLMETVVGSPSFSGRLCARRVGLQLTAASSRAIMRVAVGVMNEGAGNCGKLLLSTVLPSGNGVRERPLDTGSFDALVVRRWKILSRSSRPFAIDLAIWKGFEILEVCRA